MKAGLDWSDHPEPGLVPGSVRIRIRAAAVNRADLMQARGTYPPPPGASPILGLECAGEVIEGEGWSPGDRVCALLAGGGYAQEAVCPAVHCLPVPDGFSFVEAAALPEVFATAWLNLFREARLGPGDRALIHAGASGVGTAALQLCAVRGVRTFVTVGSREKLDRCLALGAEAGAIRHGGWVEAARAWGPVQGILDCVGAAYLADDLQVLDIEGSLVLIGLLGGRRAEIDLGRVLMKRLRLIGSTLRSRSDAVKASILADLHEHVWPHLGTRIHPIIDRVLPASEAREAHAVLERNENVGKVVLEIQ